MVTDGDAERYDDYAEDEVHSGIEDYDITAVPSDFNVMTLVQLVKSGWMHIPGFQRHFVWDRSRASRLIESLILGLPVPQLFLYQQDRDRSLLIDGQQRLMSIYYFKEQRFPRTDERINLRRIFDETGGIPDEVLRDDRYFQDFTLWLSKSLPNQRNELSGLNYDNLADHHRSRLDMRPVRCITIKQNRPSDGDAAMYEIFNRLNSGGMNLRQQEIRASMYHSEFYDMLGKINGKEAWRVILQSPVPDLHMKDIEILLRGFAMLIDGREYQPSMVKFLNKFSKKCESNKAADNRRLNKLFMSFLRAASGLPEGIFINKANNRFNIALFEAVFTAVCRNAYQKKGDVENVLDAERIERLRTNEEFIATAQKGTTQKANVETRLRIASEILIPEKARNGRRA